MVLGYALFMRRLVADDPDWQYTLIVDADEALPPYPTCRAHPIGVIEQVGHDDRVLLTFETCGHRLRADAPVLGAGLFLRSITTENM